jgi:hypothetical protein
MQLLPREDVLAFLGADEEIPGAIRWAMHYGLAHTWDEATLTFRVWFQGGRDDSDREPYLLGGTFEDFPTMPPAWRFLDPRSGRDIGPAAYPAAGPFQNGSVLHAHGVICAPWNRLAYADQGGPHADWTEPTRWQQLAPDRTHATTIPDMLARLRAEVAISASRLAPLPPHAGPEVTG